MKKENTTVVTFNIHKQECTDTDADTDTGSDSGPILTRIAGSGIGNNGANLFNFIICLYTIIRYILEFEFLLKF